MTTLAPPRDAARPGAADRPVPRAARWPLAALWCAVAAYAAVFSWLSIQRHRAFFTGRLDLGNMLQAAWTTAHGDPLSTTDLAGRQISRLSVHVDPLLALLAPVVRLWPQPVALLVVQAAAVALGAVPVFLLGRRWLRDDRLALAGAALYLLYPPLQWATVTEFHPVTLAAPLLAGAIWAADAGRYGWLAATAGLALLAKEEVGMALVVLGIWMAVRGRRRAGAWLAGVSAAWVAIAVAVVIPAAGDGGSPLASRYSTLGDGPGGALRGLVVRPWEGPEALARDWRYLLALLVPLLLLPLGAPLLAAGALPEVLVNVLSSHAPQHEIIYHYAAVPAPFLVAASVVAVARLRERARPALMRRALGPAVPVALGMVAVAWASGVHLGPLPWWQDLPGGSDTRTYEYIVTRHAEALARAVAVIPDGEPVSASNAMAAHLSARRRVMVFPVVADARWVAFDIGRAPLGLEVGPFRHAVGVVSFQLARRDFRLVYAENGAMVFRRAAA
ncbi:MAG: DUF2079 domain-containing protein [Actinomycetota bacterium]